MESPVDAGFGPAALDLTDRFRMDAVGRDGQPTAGGEVRIPIIFMAPV